MADYGMRYAGNFSSNDLVEKNYLIQIFFKGYTGLTSQVICAARPVIHTWDKDDPKAPVKGSSLVVTLANTGNLPLTTFYSTESNYVKAVLWWSDTDQILFTGFLVQDDCAEVLTDANHEIKLSFNDNLGLLKEIALDEVGPLDVFTGSGVMVGTTAPPYVGGYSAIYFPGTIAVSKGDVIVIAGGTSFDGTYTANGVVLHAGGSTIIAVNETLTTNAATAADITITTTLTGSSRVSLFNIIAGCLRLTNVDIWLKTFFNLHETTQDLTRNSLVDTYVDPGSFLINETEYDNCYEILEKLLGRFNASLFQAGGTWNVIRWDESRYYNAIPGFIYDENFQQAGTTTLDDLFTYSVGGPEAGLLGRIFSSYKYDKERFEYEFPESLIRNSALQQLGALVSDTTSAGIRYKVYQFPTSSGWASWYGDDSKIVVTYDVATGKELERYVRQNWVTSANITQQLPSYGFNEIEVNRGDIIDISFAYKADANTTVENFYILINLVGQRDGSPTPPSIWYSLTQVTSGADTFYRWNGFTTDYQPNEPQGNRHNVNPLGMDVTEWQQFNIKSYIEANNNRGQKAMPPIPVDGLLKIYVVGWNTQGNQSKTGYLKDLQFGLTFGINDSTNVIGQTHTTTQPGDIKNKEDEDIYLDDSPRNSISGTLFLGTYSGLIRKRTNLWRRDAFAEAKPLGQITTGEVMFWRSKARTILEGNVVGLTITSVAVNVHLSLLTTTRFSVRPGIKFIFGRLEIDYRYNSWRGTVWEIADDGENPGVLNAVYEFQYQYKVNV